MCCVHVECSSHEKGLGSQEQLLGAGVVDQLLSDSPAHEHTWNLGLGEQTQRKAASNREGLMTITKTVDVHSATWMWHVVFKACFSRKPSHQRQGTGHREGFFFFLNEKQKI